MEGYNGTIFAYGQTGSGKTYTIQGPNYEDLENGTAGEETIGLMPRSFHYIFNHIREKESEDSNTEFLVKCSYFEIYNEHIMDLLDANHGNLLIRENIKKGVYVEGLTEEVTSSANDMMEIIKRGVGNRHVGATSMNERSSRSHSVLTCHIESKTQKEGLWNIRMSRFHIIDLAGSERSKAANTQGERLKEAGMINKSLSTLGNVINSLVEVSEGRVRHIHYRDSKLTFLLRDSLGGNSKTLIIANVSPSSSSFGETLSTLKFAQRAKLIKNNAIINEDSAGTVAILKDEIKRLKLLLAKQQTSEPDSGSKLHHLFSKTLEKIDSYDDEGSPNYSPEKEKDFVTKKRILELEKLLQRNLDYTAQIQEYNEKDAEDKDEIIKKLQTTCESLEKQHTRDKMIIKFRDSTIKRFGSLTEKLNNEEYKLELTNKINEIELLNSQIESNPQTAQLFVENKQLKKEKTELKKFVDKTRDSLYSQYRSAIEFVDTLNKYIKDYIEKEEMDRDEIIKSQVDIERAELKILHEEEINRLEEIIYQSNANYERLAKELAEVDQEKQEALTTIFSLKQEIQSIREKSQEELELAEKRFTESLDQVKAEVKEGKESEIQEYKIRMIEQDKHNEEVQKTVNKLKEQQEKSDECIEEMRKSLENLEKEKQDLLTQLQNIQEQVISKDEEISSLKEIEKAKEALDSEHNTLKSEYKKLEKNYTKSNESLITIKEELAELKDKYTALEEENDTNLKEYDYKVSELEKELAVTTKAKDEAEGKLNVLNEAEEMLKLELKRQSSKSEDMLSDFKQEQENANKRVVEIQQQLDAERVRYSELEKRIEALEQEKEQLTIDYEMKCNDIDAQRTELDKVKEELQSLQQRYNAVMDESNGFEEQKSVLQEKISDLEVKLEWLTVSESDKRKLIQSLEKDLESVKESAKKKDADIEKLKTQRNERDAILKETQQTIKGSKESIKLLRDEKERLVKESEKLRKDNSQLEEKIHELEMERQIKEEQDRKQREEEAISKENMEILDKEKEDQEPTNSSKVSLESKDINSPTTTLTPEEAKVLLYQIKKREKEQRKREEALREEIEDLKFQLDKMQTISDYQGHNNPGQKIRHLLKIKEENNLLKKELCKLFAENRKMKESEESKNSSSKNIEFYETKAKKYKAELERKRKELKETMNKAIKM